MKIEFGKVYKTCSGEKVRIYAVDAGGAYPVHGAIKIGRSWRAMTWTMDGVMYRDGTGDDRDIVSEWVEPRPRLLAWIFKGTGEVVFEPSTRRIDEGYQRATWLDEPEGGE